VKYLATTLLPLAFFETMPCHFCGTLECLYKCCCT
jgi:hypothetical protein